MNFYLRAFLIFFRIGLFTIGGGYAMVPLIEADLVDKRKWVKKEDFLDLMALAQTVPGIFAVNIAIFIGYKLKGFWGAFWMALGTILPSFLIILTIALFFRQFQHVEAVEHVFKGIRPAVVALIAAPTFKMAKSAVSAIQYLDSGGFGITDMASCFRYLRHHPQRLGGYLYGRYQRNITKRR